MQKRRFEDEQEKLGNFGNDRFNEEVNELDRKWLQDLLLRDGKCHPSLCRTKRDCPIKIKYKIRTGHCNAADAKERALEIYVEKFGKADLVAFLI